MERHDQGELLCAYVDGELSGVERASVESHLTDCASCRAELASFGAVKRLAASAPRRTLPPEVLAGLEERLLRPSWRAGVFALLARPRVWAPAGAALAAAAFFALWGAFTPPEEAELPLEPLLAAHSRYAAETLVADGNMASSNFSVQLAAYHAEQ